jgi:hypothetical protein
MSVEISDVVHGLLMLGAAAAGIHFIRESLDQEHSRKQRLFDRLVAANDLAEYTPRIPEGRLLDLDKLLQGQQPVNLRYRELLRGYKIDRHFMKRLKSLRKDLRTTTREDYPAAYRAVLHDDQVLGYLTGTSSHLRRATMAEWIYTIL